MSSLRLVHLSPFALLLLALRLFPVQAAAPAPAGWLMFHRNAQHTAVVTAAEARGAMLAGLGPRVRWTYRVVDEPATPDSLIGLRWYASFPIGDLDGDGTLEVAVTTPDNTAQHNRVIALKDRPGQDPPVQALWIFTDTTAYTATVWSGFDQYSAALADADGDGVLDVLFTAKNGMVRALKGATGELIWQYDTGHFIEAGPMVADLEGDGQLEVIVPTDCVLGEGCPGTAQGGALYVFAADPPGSPSVNPPLWWRSYPKKLDSAEPAIADLDPSDGRNLKAIVFGSWNGSLYVLWRDPDSSQFVEQEYRLATHEDDVPDDSTVTVIRSSPLVADFGQGWTAVFGWMPDWQVGTEAQISAVGISVTTTPTATVTFTRQWTVHRDDWKSSVALLPVTDPPRVVTGYGIGTITGTGQYGKCDPVTGGIIALNADGSIAWEHNLGPGEGNVRGSPAVADVDGDGSLDVLLTTGCYGQIHAYDGVTGAEKWAFQLGPRTIASPAVADLDGDGRVEIIVASYDGQVWALERTPSLYLPSLRR
jgi:outer membrane protein assembly factor BamB